MPQNNNVVHNAFEQFGKAFDMLEKKVKKDQLPLLNEIKSMVANLDLEGLKKLQEKLQTK